MINNEIGRSVGGEYYLGREITTIASLLGDNRSARAVEGRAEHATNKAEKNLFLVIRCSDSRIISTKPTGEAVIRSIGGAVNIDSFSSALRNPIYSGVVLEGHFSGQNKIEGSSPQGCGGREIKDKLLKGKNPKRTFAGCSGKQFRFSNAVLGYRPKHIEKAKR